VTDHVLDLTLPLLSLAAGWTAGELAMFSNNSGTKKTTTKERSAVSGLAEPKALT
jgi:hypothetical protein